MMRPIGEEASAQVESDACAHASPCFHARAPPTAPHETARRMRRRMPASRIPLPPPLPALPAATPLPRETVCALRPSLAACLLLIPPPGRAELHPQLRSSQLRSSHPPQTNRRRSNKKKPADGVKPTDAASSSVASSAPAASESTAPAAHHTSSAGPAHPPETMLETHSHVDATPGVAPPSAVPPVAVPAVAVRPPLRASSLRNPGDGRPQGASPRRSVSLPFSEDGSDAFLSSDTDVSKKKSNKKQKKQKQNQKKQKTRLL